MPGTRPELRSISHRVSQRSADRMPQRSADRMPQRSAAHARIGAWAAGLLLAAGLLPAAGLLLAAALATALLPSRAAAYEKRLNCGDTQSYVDQHGNTFIPDQAYTAQNGAGYIGGFDQTTWKPIGGTPDEPLYVSDRVNWNEYRFNVPNGTYVLRLHFADILKHGPNIGIFDVAREGRVILDNFDIYAQVRDHYAVLYTDSVTVTDGQLNVTATLVRQVAQLSAIEVWSATPDAVPPAVPAGLAVSDCYGRVLLDWNDWTTPDHGDIAGYHVERAESPTGPWLRLTSSLCRRSRFEDANALPTFPYYYRVRAADVWGNESAPCAAIAGMIRPDTEADIPIYRISISASNWEALNLAIELDTYYPASFTYNNQTWNNVGVRYRGNTSRSVSKKSWKIKFDKFVPNQEFLDGQKELNLDSTFGERTILREKLASDYCELVDVPDFDSRHVQLRVNGEYFGVYTAPENVDKRWLRKHGFDDSGSLYKAELNAYMQVLPDTAAYMAAYTKQTNEATGYADLIQFIERVNSTPADQIYQVLTGAPDIRFDIESFINYNAAMIALSSDSFFMRNYFLYHDLLTRTWTYLPDDLDSTFGHIGIFDQAVIPNLNPLHGETNILILKLHQSPHVRRRIMERVLEMTDEAMTPLRMDTVVDTTFALMQGDAQLDWRKWGWEDPAWTDGGANEIKGYVAARQSFLQTLVPNNPAYMPPQTLFLNEIMADNDSVVADEMGDYDDWIEIVNLGGTPVDLGGYHLTDDIAAPTKWAIPDTTLAPGGHIVFWCDMEPLEGPTHTNFRLERTGEFVGLFGPAPGIQPIDAKSFGRQIKDVSYGRLPDGGYDWDLMGTPTPWAPNQPDNNLPPVITNVDHVPATPALNVAVRVTARIEDETGVAAASVFYRPGATFLEEPMFDDGTNGDLLAGDHIYTAILPGQPAPGVVNYYIRAVDTSGWDYTDPRDAPLDTHAYTVAYIPPDLYVNEFLADNVAGLVDEFGQHDDWVEIYNGGQDPVTLAGLCLSDDLAVPGKFVFPDTTIAPGAFLLVWCDNDPEQGPLHADFRLSAAGEQVGLFAGSIAGFAVIDSVTFGQQTADISFGRIPDGGAEWRRLLPTPRESNQGGIGVEPAEPAPPRELLLGPGRPNPTSGRATIPFALPTAGRVRLTVYDPSGRAVAELVDEEMSAGTYEVEWDGRRRATGNNAGGSGSQAPAGVYFYRLRFGRETLTGKIALLH